MRSDSSSNARTAFASPFSRGIAGVDRQNMRPVVCWQKSARRTGTKSEARMQRICSAGRCRKLVAINSPDTHQANFVVVPERCKVLDPALAALLSDLHTRGLLRETLVVLATEFGLTPGCANLGREHDPNAFSGLMAGGGIKAGFAYGKTDKEGGAVVENAVEVPDFNATIAYALGLPLDKKVMSPSNRPFSIADKGKPVTALFA